MEYKMHPYADLFPDMDEDAFKLFVEDIRVNGQQVPIVLYYKDKSILDGRHRYRACKLLGIEPKTIISTAFDDDAAMNEVISLNIQRRDNSPAQKAFAADNWANLKQGAQKQNTNNRYTKGSRDPFVQNEGDETAVRTLERAAELFKSSTGSIKRIRVIRLYAPSIINAVLRGNPGDPTLTTGAEYARLQKATEDAHDKATAEQRAREAAEQAARDRQAAEDLLNEAAAIMAAASGAQAQAAAQAQKKEAEAQAVEAAREELKRNQEAAIAKEESEQAAKEAEAKEARARSQAEMKAKLTAAKENKKQNPKPVKPKAVQPKPKPKPEPKETPFLTREQVDPEFTGSDMEFTRKYGHVWLQTAEQRAKDRFGFWASHLNHLQTIHTKSSVLQEVDLNWLRSPKSYDVNKMRKAIDELEPLIKYAKTMLDVAEQAVAKQEAKEAELAKYAPVQMPAENDDELQPETSSINAR